MPVGGARAGLFGGGVAIPDSDVYLQDDWGDNKLQNREGSGTTTYNGVAGVYRPEYTISGSPTATNESINIEQVDDDVAYADINLNFNFTITWTFTGINFSGGTTGAQGNLQLFSATTNRTDDDGAGGFREGYSVGLSNGPGQIRLLRGDTDGTYTTLINANIDASNISSVTVTRSDTGEWELVADGTSYGTTTDTTHTTDTYFGFLTRGSAAGGDADYDINEVKVN